MRKLEMFAVILIFLTGAFASDTVQFRGDARHTGIYQAAVPDGTPFVKWRFKTGNKVRSTPAIYEGLVIFGSNDRVVYALDEASGGVNWSFRTGGVVSSSPAVADGVLYVSSGDGNIYAITAKSGKKVWSFATGKELPFRNMPDGMGPADYGLWDFYLSSPTVAEGRLFVGSGDGNVYALDARTGKQLWAFKTGGRVRSTPAVADGTVYAGSMNGYLFALDAATGELKWKFKTAGNRDFPEGSVQSSPAVGDGMVYFGSRDSLLYALDKTNGNLKWKYSHDGSWVIGSPAIADGMLFVGSSDARFVQALDMATGKEIWREKLDGNVFGSAAVAGKAVIVTDWNGVLSWRDKKTGKQTNMVIVEDRINSSPVVDQGMIFFGADDDYLYAVGIRTKATE